MTSPPIIDKEHLPVCKMGQGHDCCRYLVVSTDFACAKMTTLKATIDARAAAGTMTARGDNCPGLP